ncbi:hypothetical protein PIB30_030215 [Stylosanthes scabra]|uniref:Uncharacterized protein n=1 Tax=Stylosanthes scabra TaxID=79078 RepID=A0ABU6UE58_9FABA|nr:hypothetical protein [Stylosanthes scabra]
MEVLVGPTFTIDVSAPPPPPTTAAATADQERVGSGFRISGQPKFFAGDLSESSSSSIGTPDDDDDSGDEEEIQSGLKGGLSSLDSLEDSLPIKRGLSSHFDGKSKSFTDLSQVNTMKELQKQESPFNKRRRVLIASRWRKSSFYTWSNNPTSMPLFPVNEDHDDDDDVDHYGDDDDDDDDDHHEQGKARKVPSTSSSSSSSSLSEEKEKKHEDQVQVQVRHTRIIPESYAAHMRLRLRNFKTRSFSLADLQEHADEEDHDD